MELLHHLIYQSTATMVFSGPQLGQLMHHVQQRNLAAGVTGMLWYGGCRFLQIMEGPAPVLEHLLARIRLDCRHAWLQVLASGSIRNRQFDAWVTAVANGQELLAAVGDAPRPVGRPRRGAMAAAGGFSAHGSGRHGQPELGYWLHFFGP